jgi:acetyl esterase
VALEWLVGHAGELGLAQDRISIGGVSSGANLAAAAALHARDGNGPALIAQVLDIPVLDLTMSQPSIDAFASGYMLTRERLAQEIDDYCPPERRTERWASPLLADDVAGLPPTLIATAEYDLLRDDGERYAERLADAGVPVTTQRWLGNVHGSHRGTSRPPSSFVGLRSGPLDAR